jgi:hypothetical protein
VGLGWAGVEPDPQQLDEQDIHDAVEHRGGPRLGPADFAGEQAERGVQGGAGLACGDVQDIRQQGEQRHSDSRVLAVRRAQDPGLPWAGAYAQALPGRQGVLGREMVERHGAGVGRAGQDVGDAGGEQDDIARHQPDVWPAGDAQPGEPVGDGVEGCACCG